MLVALLALIGCTPEPVDSAEPEPTLADRVEIDALTGHLDALQAIADANGGTRVSGSAGYAASVDYVAGVLEDAGYVVERDPYEVVDFDVNAASVTVGPDAIDHSVLEWSPSGDVTAAVVPVDVQIPPGSQPNSSTSGCEASDFVGFPAGSIALVQRGSCTFGVKVALAEAAGAVAVVVFNEGQTNRREVVEGVLDPDDLPTIPVVGISYPRGEEWVEDPVTAHVVVDTTSVRIVEHNVIARTPGGDPARTVLVGAHLDSVAAGPGINDNGSGSALVLETAVQAARHLDPENQVAFAFWGAEESGLVGSWHWVYDEETEGVDVARTGSLIAYLNYDMVASGNGYRWVYDGDGSSFGDGASAASGAIEAIFHDWFDALDQETDPTALFIPSDSYWFVAEGIPTGGLFSGAFEQIDAEQAAESGAQAGDDADPCYHQACDTRDGIDVGLYEELARAGVHAIETLAMRTDPLPAGGRAAPRKDLPRPFGCHHDVVWDR